MSNDRSPVKVDNREFVTSKDAMWTKVIERIKVLEAKVSVLEKLKSPSPSVSKQTQPVAVTKES